MDDDSVPLPNYVTPRNGVYQYVRRVPDDISDAFVSPRIQRSLKTRLPSEARSRAAELDRDIERQFAEARRRKGFNTEFLPTVGWSWIEWSQVVEWLKATWLHQDQCERSKGVLGSHFSRKPGSKPLWLSDHALRRKLDLRDRLLGFTPEQYGREEGTRLAETLKPIGLALPNVEPYRSEFLTACLRAEVEATESILQREGGERIDHAHPDSIDGAWRRSSAPRSPPNDTDRLPQKAAISVGPPVVSPAIPVSQDQGRSLSDCIDEWIRERLRLRKKVDSHLVNDMRATTAWFTKFTKVVTIDDIRRRHVISFRDHLFDKGEYKTATINKKVGYITSLMSLAAAKGWVETAIEGGIYIEIPSDEDKRDSYSAEELATLFSSPVFTRSQRSSSVKSGGELQFWLPLIACCHGMISSEILQLGHDTVVQHPGTDIWCFRVTNAGGRMIKTYARERYVPIRHEFLELGILDLAENAQKRNWTTLWAALEQPGWTVTNMSNYFSAYWTTFSRKQLGTVPARKSLYSFRHAFKDELDRQKTPLEIKQALMGHSDGGTTGRYGSKSTPRPVNAGILQNSINELEWKFLSNVRSR